MPISIQKLAEARRTVTFKFLGEDVAFEYKLGALNSVDTAATDEETTLHDLLGRILVRWDVLDEQGQEIPPTAEAMRQHRLPTPFLRAVQEALLDDANPNSLRKGRSPDSSVRGAR